jgi:hypothetical protein
MEITLSNGWLLQVPEGYEKKPLAILNEWVAALRSGKYKQGRRYLRSCNDTYCCLGVLCEIEGVQWELSKRGNAYYIKDSLSESLHLYFGDSGVSIEGDISPCAVHDGVNVYNFLAYMNDLGLPFHDIATILEHVYVQAT